MNLKFLFVMALTATMISCNKDEDEGASGGADFFECSVDGAAYNISGKFAFADEISVDLFGIYGSEDQTKPGFTNMYISLPKVGVGTFDLSNASTGSGNILQTASGTLFNSNFPGGGGKVEITEKTSTRVKGTFSFVGVSPSGAKKTVTNGKFDVPIK